MSSAQLHDLFAAGNEIAGHTLSATRTPPNPKQNTTVATIEGYVTAAEQHGGGWVQLVFHHLCDQCDGYSISSANFSALLDWLEPRSSIGTAVETTAQLIGGPVMPAVGP